MGAEVIQFPAPEPREPDCRICEHAIVGEETYCRVFREVIWNEALIASECEVFEEDEHKR